jgi:hypothetical protein
MNYSELGAKSMFFMPRNRANKPQPEKNHSIVEKIRHDGLFFKANAIYG